MMTTLSMLFSTSAFSKDHDDDNNNGPTFNHSGNQHQAQAQQSYNAALSNAEATAKANSYANSAANSASNSGVNSNIANTVNPNQSSNSTGSTSNSTTTFSNKYPNQAPPIYTTSSPSFSQRNCTPVGSVNGSGPFGGLGIAFPMGGDTCNGLNISDKVKEWRTDSNDEKLWLVECNLMISANDDLEEAFEKSGYSCQAAYNERISKIRAAAQQQTLNIGAMRKKEAGL